MRETAAYKYRIFALLLIVAAFLRETHLGLSGISNIGRCYQRVHQCTSDDFALFTASAPGRADTIECVDYTIVRDACTRELLDSSQSRGLNGSFRGMNGRRRETGTAFRHFFAAVLALHLAAAGGIRRLCRSFSPYPSGKLLILLDYIHKLDGKK